MFRSLKICFAVVIGFISPNWIGSPPTSSAADNTVKRASWNNARMVGTPQPPPAFKVVAAFPRVSFDHPTSIELIPASNRLLVTEIGGRVFSLVEESDVSQADLVGDLKEFLAKDLAGKSVSLFDAEFHPRFQDNRFVFLSYVHPGDGGHSRVSRFRLTQEATPKLESGSELVIIKWPSGGHNGGCLEFSPEGLLYISTGDGTGPNPPDGLTTGQTVTDLLGAVLRINVDERQNGLNYSIPSDNPFVAMAGARSEIWSYGFRNPWKFGVDPITGNTFVADNGWESWEMVHRISRGSNGGWPVMEGRAALRTEVPVGPTPIVPPAKDHSHTEANSVIGGPVYRGNRVSELVGSFIYGDYITGTIWSLRPEEGGIYSHRTLVDTDLRITAFAEGRQGQLFVLDYDFTGQIYELQPSGLVDRSADFPLRLSETGLFDSLTTLTPAPGVIPFEPRVPRWMDGAKARRWIAIPGEGRVQFDPINRPSSQYPDGTVFVKHIELPQADGSSAIRLETQVLQFANGVWHPYSYLWDDEGQDARLVDSIGTSRPIRGSNSNSKDDAVDRTWHVNAINECKLCHNVGPGFVLGFTPNQLSFSLQLAGNKPAEQLPSLISQGVVSSGAATNPPQAVTLVDPHDTRNDLDARARSYLHANCAMCHHPGGNAIVSFFLQRDSPFDKLNTNKGTGIGTFGIQDARLIVPGAPDRSILLYRMSKLGYARMPYIGSRVVDSAGVALIAEWIRSLPGDISDSAVAAARLQQAPVKALHSMARNRTVAADARDTALKQLVGSTDTALELAILLHSGKLPGDAHQVAVSMGRAAKSTDIRGLFETFVPESQRRATLGARVDPQTILSLAGDVGRGKLIFYSDGARCRACHEIEDKTQSLGTTLKEINKKYPRPAEMLQHVLQPSLKIDEALAAYSVNTKEGRSFVGLLVERSDTEIALRTAEKKIVRLKRDQVDELRRSDKSLMPDQILSDLTPQEAADLFAFIRSLGEN